MAKRKIDAEFWVMLPGCDCSCHAENEKRLAWGGTCRQECCGGRMERPLTGTPDTYRSGVNLLPWDWFQKAVDWLRWLWNAVAKPRKAKQ